MHPADLPVATIEEKVAQAYNTLKLPSEVLAAARADLEDFIQSATARRDTEVKRQRRRLGDLKDRSVKLLRAHLADVVPLDVLKEEQDGLRREQAQAEAILERLEGSHAETLTTFDEMVDLLTSLSEGRYRSLAPEDRRALNPVLITHALVDAEDGKTRLQLTELGQVIHDIKGSSVDTRPKDDQGGHTDSTRNPQLTLVSCGFE
ncbi:hypothetical protein [Longispora fulva]|uniref:Uncharacterized protein n=1 Tax=Longispora fulva TaxID=619741 RepID=A0A8J7KJU1_9ACTN|nr:hypothetical protein [Longispora fulva]MBG6137224.1 hypothetical protein [Longispora fulva]